MKLFVYISCFICLVVCQQECSDPEIIPNIVTSTKGSIFLRWHTDKPCSYNYTVTWHPDGNTDGVESVALDLDDSKVNVTNLVPNTGYVFVVEPSNSVRNFTFFTYTAPDEIKNLTVLEIALNSIYLSWVPPAEGSGYGTLAEVCVSLYDSSERCHEINGSEYRFTGLPSCTNHTISITSIGHEAWSSSTKLRSSATISTYQTLKTVPGAATHLTPLPFQSGNIITQWEPPIWYDAPDCVLHYNVRLYRDGFTRDIIVNTTDHTFTDLDSCSTYSVSVTSIGELGESTPTTMDSVKTGPANIPGNNIVVNSFGTTWAEFSWRPTDVGSECLTEYRLYNIENYPTRIPLRNYTANEALSYNYTGLEPCDIKLVGIDSVNEEGTASPSASKVIYTLGEDPGVITNLKVNFSGSINRYVEFSWTPVITTSKCGSTYRICAHPEGSPVEYTCALVPSDSYSYNYYSLYSCTRYTFNITWWTPMELTFSTWSVTETIPAYYPYVLGTITARSNGDETYVTWSYPSDYGRDCIQYFNVCWAIRYNDSCLHVDNKATSVFIPERITNLFNISVTAIFTDGKESNTIYYYGNDSTILLSSPVYIMSAMILQLFLKFCS